MRMGKQPLTRGGDPTLSRIYERLRKRSLRIDTRWNELYEGSSWVVMNGYFDNVKASFYGDGSNHQAYVRGVKDALEAVEKEQA